MKCCIKCNELKTIDSFSRNKSKKDGVDIYCKKCNAEKTKNTIKDKEKIKEYNKQYRLNNSEKISEYGKIYYLNNKEIIKKNTSEYNKTEKSKMDGGEPMA